MRLPPGPAPKKRASFTGGGASTDAPALKTRNSAAWNEKELLGGQKLQGTLTAKEVNHILKMKGMEAEFPFFTTVYKISYEDTPLSAITETPY